MKNRKIGEQLNQTSPDQQAVQCITFVVNQPSRKQTFCDSDNDDDGDDDVRIPGWTWGCRYRKICWLAGVLWLSLYGGLSELSQSVLIDSIVRDCLAGIAGCWGDDQDRGPCAQLD